MQKTNQITTQKLVMTALLVAIYVVLSRFLSIPSWDFKIGFSFLPVVIGALVLGPIYGGLIGGLGDLVGAILFPIGAYFPGYTATAFLMGWLYGMILKEEQSKKRIVIAVVIPELICSLLLNTLWISITYGASFTALFATRSIQFAVMSVVKIITIAIVVRYIPYFKKATKSA